jgi:hypothetical protein
MDLLDIKKPGIEVYQNTKVQYRMEWQEARRQDIDL